MELLLVSRNMLPVELTLLSLGAVFIINIHHSSGQSMDVVPCPQVVMVL